MIQLLVRPPSNDFQGEPPHLVHAAPLLLSGLRHGYTPATAGEIPALWETLAPHLGRIPRQIGPTVYGVRFRSFAPSGYFHYLAGVETTGYPTFADTWSRVSLPAQRYATFRHRGHASTLAHTADAILRQWLPDSGECLACSAREEPLYLERYTEEFNPHTGRGGVELWFPLRN